MPNFILHRLCNFHKKGYKVFASCINIKISRIIEEDIVKNGRYHLLINLHKLYNDSLERIYAQNSIEMNATFTAHHPEEEKLIDFSKDIKF